MICIYKIIFMIIILLQSILFKNVEAESFNAITVINHVTQSTITLDFDVVPIYVIFYLHNPERIVIDFSGNYSIKNNILPMNFNNNNLVKCIRLSTPVKPKSVRIVIDLSCVSIIEMMTQKKIRKNFRLTLTVIKKKFVVSNMNVHTVSPVVGLKNLIFKNNKREVNNIDIITSAQFNNSNKYRKRSSLIVVAIDAGHGGQDPGATVCNGIYEKNITINIAKKLKKLLDLDPVFNAVMIRDGDYFLSVMERSDIARKKGANVLISIHTDSTLNANVRGASVWILSNRRAKIEMTYLLKRSEKHSELLGGLGDILTNHYNDPYFNHFVLDSQFVYSQRVGYDIAIHVLRQLKNISILHKDLPTYSSFAVLRSPDIPSLLVETGFISNKKEMYLLISDKYQEKIANAIYKGLRAYFIKTKFDKNLLKYNFRAKNTYFITKS